MHEASFAYNLGQVCGAALLALLISLGFKDKNKKLLAFLISLIIFLFLLFKPAFDTKEPVAPTSYKVNLPEQKTVSVSSTAKNQIHVSRPEGFNGLDIFLKKCTPTETEQKILYTNMELQKAFTIQFVIQSSYSSLRELSRKCPHVDLLDTVNINKKWLDKQLELNKAVFIKHLGQDQYNCFNRYILTELNEQLAPASGGVFYAQLQQQAAGRMTACQLLRDNVFQSNLYAGFVDTIKKLVDNNNPLVWKTMFDPNIPEQNDFNIHYSDKGSYIR